MADGTPVPNQARTVGVRSVSSTSPGCLVDAAPSNPSRYPGPSTTITRRCGCCPSPGAITISVPPAGVPARIAPSLGVVLADRRLPGGVAAARRERPEIHDPVSGHCPSTAGLGVAAAVRYRGTCPARLASASAAPAPRR